MGIITYKEKAMFIGSRYSLCDQEGRSSLGYGDITIKERVLSRTETRFKSTSANIVSYHYTLLCLVDGHDSSEIMEDQLQDEIIAGYYQFYGSK
tara:strand:- start:164 stop:445 length:282 start_codon:yes stop_codon:yes gene_type:complete